MSTFNRALMLCCAAATLLATTAGLAAETYVFDRQWGTQGSALGQLSEPFGMAIYGSRLWVADRGNGRLQSFNLDGTSPQAFTTIGGTDLYYVGAVRITSAGRMYVTTDAGDVISCNTALGNVFHFQNYGTGAAQTLAISGVGIDQTHNLIYAADLLNDRISVWSIAGAHQYNIGSTGTGNGQFSHAADVSLDSAFNLYAVDQGGRRIEKFNASHAYVGQWTGAGGVAFGYLNCVTVDNADNVFVSDYGNNKVWKLRPNGSLVTAIGGPGTGPGQFAAPTGMALDSQRRLYVADSHNHRIQRFIRDLLPTAPATVSIAPKSPADGSKLTATASGATDGDDVDATLTYVYQWYKSSNGATWASGPAGSTMLASQTRAGQYWKVKARAHDGHAYGPWKFSAVVKILPNTATPALVATAQQAGSGSVAVTLSLKGAATVEGQLRNLAGVTVAVLPTRQLEGGTSALLLPARSRSGARLPAGQYWLRLTARTGDGQSATALTPVTIR